MSDQDIGDTTNGWDLNPIVEIILESSKDIQDEDAAFAAALGQRARRRMIERGEL
jgi:hypothetical protein